MKPIASIFTAVLVAATAAFAFDGDITMETTTGGQTMSIDLVAKGDKVKISPPGGQGTMIMDIGANEMTIVMDAQRMYMTRPLTDLQTPQSDGTLEDTGETKKLMGYEVRKVIYTEPDGRKSVIWATKDLGSSALTNMPGVDENMVDQLEKVFGTRDVLPLESVTTTADGTVESTMTVTKIEARDVPASEVTPPADYNEFQMPAGAPQMPQQ